MKIININISPLYSCDVCSKPFRSKIELVKNPYDNPKYLTICSKLCEFRFIYDLIKKQDYSKENLLLLLKIIGKKQNNAKFSQSVAVLDLSKYYTKIGLSNITRLCQADSDKINVAKSLSLCQLTATTTPYIYRGLSQSLARPSFRHKLLSYYGIDTTNNKHTSTTTK